MTWRQNSRTTIKMWT